MIDVRYDVAIDFGGFKQNTALAALSVDSLQRFIWVHTNITNRIQIDWKFHVSWLLQNIKYRYFTRIVVVSDGLRNETSSVTSVPIENISVVGNLINIDEILEISSSDIKIGTEIDESKYNLVTVGRLVYEKGVDLLLEELSHVLKYRDDVRLYIVGDGPEMGALKSLANELRIDESVVFLGAIDNPYALMKKMDGYASMSRHEGQGISIIEAMVLGLDIYIPKHLERYNGVALGSESVCKSIISAVKNETRKNMEGLEMVSTYNAGTLKMLDSLLKSLPKN